jgi:hypothetical protein
MNANTKTNKHTSTHTHTHTRTFPRTHLARSSGERPVGKHTDNTCVLLHFALRHIRTPVCRAPFSLLHSGGWIVRVQHDIHSAWTWHPRHFVSFSTRLASPSCRRSNIEQLRLRSYLFTVKSLRLLLRSSSALSPSRSVSLCLSLSLSVSLSLSRSLALSLSLSLSRALSLARSLSCLCFLFSCYLPRSSSSLTVSMRTCMLLGSRSFS